MQNRVRSGKWVTCEHPKNDRIAFPWLIRRFINPEAKFIYVPGPQVRAAAKELDAIPYDIDDVEFTHERERCSFDAIVRIFDIQDKALEQLAAIVRGADTSRSDLSRQCSGLRAVFKIGKRALQNRTMVALAAAAFVAIFFFGVSFPIIVITAALIDVVDNMAVL
jgi:hypothetical protein